MAATPDLAPVVARLRSLLEPYAAQMVVTADSDTQFHLDTGRQDDRQRAVYFAGIRTGARAVSFYLMPVYTHPDLLADISPELRRRMQGKSCFNFARVDEPLIEELAALTQQGHAQYVAEGLAAPA